MASVIRGSDNFDSKPYASFPIGVPFAIWDHFAPVLLPDNSGSIKFIKLTANDSYNDGLLTNETVSGSAPLVEATAEIDVGPLVGLTVHLLNTEEAVVRARGTSGALQMDQMQRITGVVNSGAAGIEIIAAYTSLGDGALNAVGSESRSMASRVGGGRSQLQLNSANSPDARASSTTAGETRAKNVSATYYMRVA